MTEQTIEVRAPDGEVYSVLVSAPGFIAALRTHYGMAVPHLSAWPDAQSVTFTEQEKAEPIYSRKREARPRDVFG